MQIAKLSRQSRLKVYLLAPQPPSACEQELVVIQQQLARYNVKLKKIIPYKNVEGCQIDATNIINQMQLAGITSLIFSGDPICPIHLTRAAQNQGATWAWIVTGSALTDTNNFGRLYNQEQWSPASGVSMLNPDVKNEKLWVKGQPWFIDDQQQYLLRILNSLSPTK